MNRTKKMKRLSNLFFFFSLLSQIFPLLFYSVKAVVDNSITTENKITFSLALITAGVMFVINFIRKKNLRSPFYIILLGIYFALDDLLPLVFMMAICCMLDEFIFSPLHEKFKAKYKINKEIDARE